MAATTSVNVLALRTPYLIFVGNEKPGGYAKTGAGLAEWCPEKCLGQVRLSDEAVDLGLPDMTAEEAATKGAGSIIIGVANPGGIIPDEWLPPIFAAAEAGMDVVAGLHTKLCDIPGLADAAAKGGGKLIDVRNPPAGLPVGTGKKRTGKRLLTVGTDCSVGKKYTALAIAREMQARGMKADFRASGQTGIMIAGRGLPIDTVISDFLSGAAELLSPDNEPDHWDIVEGQGSIFHPGYAAVTLGLLHGSQPDAIVVCHEAGRKIIGGWPHYNVPTIQQVIDRVIENGQLTNPDIKCVGVAVNTASLPADERTAYLKALSEELGLPCVDPIATGTGPIVDALS